MQAMHPIRVAVAAVVLSSAAAQARTGEDLAGPWLFGAYGPEPKEAVVRVPQRCWAGGVDFTLSEVGKKVTGTARWIEAVGGAWRPMREETEVLTGAREGNHVVLLGQHTVVIHPDPVHRVPGTPGGGTTTVRYDLRFDPRTRHLVGTRDGKPIWLVRFTTYHADCGPPPP